MQDEVQPYKGKPTLLALREKYEVDIVQLAYSSDVDSSVVYYMLLGEPVDRSKALLVIEGLSKLVGVDYTLDDISISLKVDQDELN